MDQKLRIILLSSKLKNCRFKDKKLYPILSTFNLKISAYFIRTYIHMFKRLWIYLSDHFVYRNPKFACLKHQGKNDLNNHKFSLCAIDFFIQVENQYSHLFTSPNIEFKYKRFDYKIQLFTSQAKRWHRYLNRKSFFPKENLIFT